MLEGLTCKKWVQTESSLRKSGAEGRGQNFEAALIACFL